MKSSSLLFGFCVLLLAPAKPDLIEFECSPSRENISREVNNQEGNDQSLRHEYLPSLLNRPLPDTPLPVRPLPDPPTPAPDPITGVYNPIPNNPNYGKLNLIPDQKPPGYTGSYFSTSSAAAAAGRPLDQLPVSRDIQNNEKLLHKDLEVYTKSFEKAKSVDINEQKRINTLREKNRERINSKYNLKIPEGWIPTSLDVYVIGRFNQGIAQDRDAIHLMNLFDKFEKTNPTTTRQKEEKAFRRE